MSLRIGKRLQVESCLYLLCGQSVHAVHQEAWHHSTLYIRYPGLERTVLCIAKYSSQYIHRNQFAPCHNGYHCPILYCLHSFPHLKKRHLWPAPTWPSPPPLSCLIYSGPPCLLDFSPRNPSLLANLPAPQDSLRTAGLLSQPTIFLRSRSLVDSSFQLIPQQ